MAKKKIEYTENMQNKLEYIGLNLNKIPASLKKNEPLEFRIPKFYDEKQYKQYRYVDLKDIQILLSPTNRLDEMEEKYKKSSPLADYLDNKKEENILKHVKFLRMLEQIKIRDIQKLEEEQIMLNKKIPFKVKFKGNYLWQIYYSENTDKYFMLVPTEDTDYSAFFFLLKKKLEKGKLEKIFVPIRNAGYSREYLRKSQYEDLANYLWLFTKDWPLIYDVYDKNDELTIHIVGETQVYEKIKSPYKIELKNRQKANDFYKLTKAMFILQTELPRYFTFKTCIDKNGGIEFFMDNKKLEYSKIITWINEEYRIGKKRIQEAKELITINKEKLENLKIEIATQEIEYLEKEKQISTFLECKKTFFGKFKYYFKYNKKKNKGKLENKVQIQEESFEKEVKHNNTKEDKEEKYEKTRCTIEELVELYKEFEKEETALKNLMMDINSLKLKKKNMAKKIENATLFIQEIDSHKKSIFEFWKYSNKDEVEKLAEGEEEEVNIIKKIEKVFDYEEDFEKFGKDMDKIQRKSLSKQETDSIYITSTNVLEMLNKVKNNEVSPKEIEANLRELKKQAIREKTLTEKEEFDIFGGIVQDITKVSEINNQAHRELPKDKFSILDINMNAKSIGYKLTLEKIVENIKKALEKVVVCEDILVYKAMEDKLLDEKEINVFNMNPQEEIQDIIKTDNDINFYKINLKRGSHAISFTNQIFYDNQNKTLPIGQDLSSKIVVDIASVQVDLKQKTTFRILRLEEENEFSDIEIKTINVFECDAKAK